MNQLISIIIPVYNAEKYLKKCLDSVLSQTYQHIQIICVDDGSADTSPSILDEYAHKDDRVVVIRKKNEGASVARNIALEKAIGKYLMFVDSDDWIAPDTCAIAVEAMLQYGVDVVMWSYVRELSNKTRKKSVLESDTFFDITSVRQNLYRRMIGVYGAETSQPENADALCTVWGKLYKRELIEENAIRFLDIREIGTYEDGLFNLDVFSKATSAVFINRYLYHYRKDNAVSITSAYNAGLPNLWDNLFNILQDHIDDNELDITFQTALNNRIVFSLISLGINEIEKHAGSLDTIRRISRIICSDRYKNAILVFNSRWLPIYWKLFFWFAKLRFSVGVYLLLLAIQKIRGR